jgi:hypothetical protein
MSLDARRPWAPSGPRERRPVPDWARLARASLTATPGFAPMVPRRAQTAPAQPNCPRGSPAMPSDASSKSPTGSPRWPRSRWLDQRPRRPKRSSALFFLTISEFSTIRRKIPSSVSQFSLPRVEKPASRQMLTEMRHDFRGGTGHRLPYHCMFHQPAASKLLKTVLSAGCAVLKPGAQAPSRLFDFSLCLLRYARRPRSRP